MADLATILKDNVLNPQGTANRAGTYSGFDLEAPDTKGVMEFHSSEIDVLHRIDEHGIYTTVSTPATFGDGSALTDNTFIIYPADGESSFSYWYRGKLVEETGTKRLPITADGYIYFGADGELHTGVNPHDMIVNQTLVTIIGRASTVCTYFADERHGIMMDGSTHMYMHFTRGFSWITGMEMVGISLGSGLLGGVQGGRCSDEDIPCDFAPQTEVPHMYRDGPSGDWVILPSDNKIATDVGTVMYNREYIGVWELTEVGAGNFTVQTLIATNNKINPVVWVTGQQISDDRKDIQDMAHSFAVDLERDATLTAETCVLGYCIVNSSGEVQIGDNKEVYVDYRTGVPVGRY